MHYGHQLKKHVFNCSWPGNQPGLHRKTSRSYFSCWSKINTAVLWRCANTFAALKTHSFLYEHSASGSVWRMLVNSPRTSYHCATQVEVIRKQILPFCVKVGIYSSKMHSSQFEWQCFSVQFNMPEMFPCNPSDYIEFYCFSEWFLSWQTLYCLLYLSAFMSHRIKLFLAAAMTWYRQRDQHMCVLSCIGK